MPTNLTKIAVAFNEFGILRALEPDGVTYTYSLLIGYRVDTAEGESYRRNSHLKLSGAEMAKVKDLFTSIENRIKAEEGL